MSVIDQIQVYNTQLTKEQISLAFSKSLEDYTKAEIDSMMELKANETAVDDIEAALETAVNNIETALDSKVDKITGKGLSANDYTDTDKTIVEGLYGHGIDLESGDDLNDITDAGTYYANLTAAVQISNTPVSSSEFRLEVSTVTRLKVLQKILPLPFTGNIYYRSYDGSVWSSWYVFTGTAVV